MIPNFLDPRFPPGVRPAFHGTLYTPAEAAEGNDTCLIDVPQQVLLNISRDNPYLSISDGTYVSTLGGNPVNVSVYFPAGNGQPWAIGCPCWGYMLANGATAAPGQSTIFSDFFQNPPNSTLGLVVQAAWGFTTPGPWPEEILEGSLEAGLIYQLAGSLTDL
jgi:hypothetical protein